MGKIADVIREGVAMPDQKRAQLLTLDQEFEAAKAKVKVLEAENLNLRAEVNPLKHEVERLKQRVERASSAEVLQDDAIAILKLLANHSRPTSQEIQEYIKLHRVRAELALASLLKSGHIIDFINEDGYAVYELDEKGNDYLVKTKFV